MCCDEDQGSYKVTYDGSTIVREGGTFQNSSEFAQFGRGCLLSNDVNTNDRCASLLSAAADTSTETSLFARDEEGRRYFPRPIDRSELGHYVPILPDYTDQGHTRCMGNPTRLSTQYLLSTQSSLLKWRMHNRSSNVETGTF